MKTKIYVTYDMAFMEPPKLSILDYLKHINRYNLICLALRLVYSDDRFSEFRDYCAEFFCKDNQQFAEAAFNNISRHIANNKEDITWKPLRTYIVLSQSTALELLKYAFAIDKKDYIDNVPIELQEQYLFKAILSINQTISEWEIPDGNNANGETSDLQLAQSFICSSLNNYERANLRPEYVAMLQIIKGYHFFRYCENSKIRPHLSIFLKNNGMDSWQRYLYNAIHLILYPLQNNKGQFPIIKLDGQRNGEQFLKSHSFKIDTYVPLEENKDCTFFKTHPLIEKSDDEFMPISTTFCINHIYRSIYFEFKRINETLVDSPDHINSGELLRLFTTEFSEQTLFDKYIRNALHTHRGVKLSDVDCKIGKQKGHESDFYCRDGNYILLFENKDIKIPDKVMNSKVYSELEEEIYKKLINDVGVDQLVYNIKRIDNKEFPWDNNIPNHPRVYPILVIDDSSLCVPGLNHILNDELQKRLQRANIRIKVFPLVVIELDSLIAFSNYFCSSTFRFRKMLDEYYAYLTRNRIPKNINEVMRAAFHKYLPFYIYISQELVKSPFDNSIFDEVCGELRTMID